MEEKKKILSFAAIKPYYEDNKVYCEEREIRGQNFWSWGSDNKYPTYLWNLYLNTTTLHSIIDGCVDYICGNKVISKTSIMTDDEAEDLVREIARSYMIYGGFALNIVRNKMKGLALVDCLDFKKVRSNKDGDVLYYSDDFDSKSYGRGKYIPLPKYCPDDVDIPNSIFYFKNNKYTVYPIPVYIGAIDDAEIEKSIDEYHLNSINNGFMSSVIISFNNGEPDEEQKEEIERELQDKFCGKENAGSMVVSYNKDKDHAVEINKIETDNFEDKYTALAERSREQLYTAFRATPNLFGLPSATTGFNSQEYRDAYALFYKSFIYPIQKRITRELGYIFGKDTIVIEPFDVEFSEGAVEEESVN